MIEKLKKQNTWGECLEKLNELIDAVNELHEEVENNARIRANHENLIDTLVEENNIHEKQIDELQMKLEPEKCEPEGNTQEETPRCPFCKEELSYAQEIDGGFEILTCDCPHGIWLFGNDKMWYNLEKLITELECTRKALDVAVDALSAITATPLNSRVIHDVGNKALEEITALEQKE